VDRSCAAAIVDHPDLVTYDFGPSHPLRPERIVAGLDLLSAADIWHPAEETVRPEPSPREELETVHDPAYIQAVEAAGTTGLPARELAQYGLAASDNPAFPSMHQASALVAGGSTEAARLVMAGALTHAFNPAGGLHHALPARASGFCIYNDPAVAAAVAVRGFGARVAYLDFDCHHGDGVQWIFYRDPCVLTISFHESGRYLFPGTGDVAEVGEGPGKGFSVNLPFEPFSQDRQWIEAVDAVVPALVARHKPDVLITNHGCDTHAWDPLTHLALSTASLVHQARVSHQLAHELCAGRWIAVGSGGYEWRRVVPRSWSILWAEMAGRSLPQRLPDSWRERWSAESDKAMPETFLDDESASAGWPRSREIERTNDETLRQLIRTTGL
jgi:acetoin utilization protein AcuC